MIHINILLVDDHTLFAKSLSIALEEYNEIQLLYSTHDINNLDKIIHEKNIDIVLMDINLGKISDKDGLELASNLIKLNSKIKIIILTGYDLPVYRHQAKKIGVKGFLNKNIDPDNLISTLNFVLSGNSYFPAENNNVIIEELTHTEKEILQLISKGKKRKSISTELYISERTLSNHLQNIFHKLGVSSTIEAVTKAIQMGYISPIY